jgi:5-methylcytosine-specific restriction endonuclease McrA
MAVRPCIGCRRLIPSGSYCGSCDGKRSVVYAPGRMRGGAWMKRREQLLRAFAYKCQRCGAIDRPLEIHHVDGNPANNQFSNTVPLCLDCHKRQS